MSNYYCIRCGYSSTHKGTFLRHLERAKPCKPKLGKYKKEKIYRHNKLTIPSQPKYIKSTKMSTKETKKEKKKHPGNRLTARLAAYQDNQTADFLNTKDNYDTVDEIITNENTQNKNSDISCKFCNKIFQHKQSKYRHEKFRCKQHT